MSLTKSKIKNRVSPRNMFELLGAPAKKAKAVTKTNDECAFKLTCVSSVGAAIKSIGLGCVICHRPALLCYSVTAPHAWL
jgi:hypothetical protein